MKMVKIRTSLMFCQLVWLSSASFVNFGGTGHVKETLQDDEDLAARLIKAAEFHEENSTIFLQHGNGQNSVANLVVEDDCLFRGSIVGYSDSIVLVTGCKGDLQGVQIQSQLFGDMMFTMQDGVVKPFGSKRYKRDADLDFDYGDYDDVLENPMFETQFGTLDNAEAEDLPPPPSQLELHVNVYVDKLWKGEFGRRSGPRIVRNILKQSALLLNHTTLWTKIKLVYDEENNLYTSSEHLLPNTKTLETLPKHLNGPNLTSRGEPMVHLYLTLEGNGEKSYIRGKAMLNSMCGFEKPRLIVVHKEEELRTAMTVAHELGHVLGLEHDFTLGKRNKTCGGTTEKGPFVMNWGDTRQSFSECSNIDFKRYYHLVVAEKGNFCLTKGLVGCQCNGVESILGFGKCTETPTGAKCFVNEDSGCKDMTPWNGLFLSSSPCTSENVQKEELTGYILSSTGRAAEYWGGMLGIYREMEESAYGYSRVYQQAGGPHFIYKKGDKWWCGTTVGDGDSTAYFYTTDLFSKSGGWQYWDDAWQYWAGGAQDDETIQFLPLTPTSCILQPSILITSTGPANSIRPDYLGSFTIVKDVYSGGRPVWRNTKGKVLKIRPGNTLFGVYNDMTSNSSYVLSASGPTCPTDTKAGHSDKLGINAWGYIDGRKYVEDDTIRVQ